jgi:ABC-type hemin transport system ATPase subunit
MIDLKELVLGASGLNCPKGVAMPKNARWEDSRVQFARLLCEISAALDESQTKVFIKDLSVSMDLSYDEACP